jgi:hypothetical protein
MCLIRSRNLRAPEFSPRYFGGIRVALLVSFLCCPIVFLYVLSSVLCSPLRFLHASDVRLSSPPVVRIRVHVLFTLCVFVCV